MEDYPGLTAPPPPLQDHPLNSVRGASRALAAPGLPKLGLITVEQPSCGGNIALRRFKGSF